MKTIHFRELFMLALISIISLSVHAQIEIVETEIRSTTIDHSELKNSLKNALNASSTEFKNGQIIELPYINGTIRYRALATNLMDPAFAAEFPC